MENFINRIHIENFKSVQSAKLTDLKRINLFIGRPNVGKSNVIEALSLFTIPYLRENTSKRLSNLIRIENEPELFFNGNTEKSAIISTNIGDCHLSYNPKGGLIINLRFNCEYDYDFTIDDKLNVKGGRKSDSFHPPIKRYSFNTNVTYKRSHSKYLIPPYGFNLLNIIEEYKELKDEVVEMFKEYGLEVVFDKSSQTIKVVQAEDKAGIFLVPYNSIADTLQRIIFYKAAIASNDKSILLFEEPEAHSFPPYISQLTQEMIHKTDNQYFVATHSPFILNDLLENSRSELSVFVFDYKEMQTKIKRLTDNDLHEIFQYGVDLFTNSESFV